MKHIIKNHFALCKLCFKTAPGFMTYWVYDGIRLRIAIFLEHTIGISLVLHSAEYHEPFRNVATYLIGLTILLAFFMLSDGFFRNRIQINAMPKLYQAVKEKMYHKAYQLDLECYDNPEYYDKFVLSVAEAEKCVDRFLSLLMVITTSITIVLTTGSFFLLNDPIGIAFSLVSFFTTFIFSKRLNRVNVETRMKSSTMERKRNYVQRVSYLNDYAKELRLNPQVTDILTKEFDKANEEIEELQKSVSVKRCILGFLKNYIASDFIVNGLYIIYLVFQAAVLHNIAYSTAVVLFTSVNFFKDGLRGLSDILPKASENSMYIDKIREFLQYEPKIVSKQGKELPTTPQTIQLKDVCFAYNKKDGNILNHVNLTIKKGEKVALVGYNGAGKTTLIKLIMRLYDPTSGQILYGDNDIREYDVKEYRDKIGTVFQDFNMYGASLCENVVLDDLTHTKVNYEKITDALTRSGFKERLSRLPDKLETPITTEFDKNGVNLSGGESQKVAIARVFYHGNEIMLMDEPSSALDPIAEYGLNKAMHEAAKNKAVVYISHRLSTTRDADYIYMLEHGQIIEEGTHDELLMKKGKYEQMWNVQAGRYRSKKEE